MVGYAIGIVAAIVLAKKRASASVENTAKNAILKAATGTRLSIAPKVGMITTTDVKPASENPLDKAGVPVPNVVVSGKRLKSWHEVWELKTKVQELRVKVDKLSSSSSFTSLAGNAAAKPLWTWDDLQSFAGWWIRGGERHIRAVVERVKKTGGNESFWGAEGGAGDIIKIAGDALGAVFTGGAVNDAGSAVKGVYSGIVGMASGGDVGVGIDKIATSTKNLLAP